MFAYVRLMGKKCLREMSLTVQDKIGLTGLVYSALLAHIPKSARLDRTITV